MTTHHARRSEPGSSGSSITNSGEAPGQPRLLAWWSPKRSHARVSAPSSPRDGHESPRDVPPGGASGHNAESDRDPGRPVGRRSSPHWQLPPGRTFPMVVLLSSYRGKAAQVPRRSVLRGIVRSIPHPGDAGHPDTSRRGCRALSSGAGTPFPERVSARRDVRAVGQHEARPKLFPPALQASPVRRGYALGTVGQPSQQMI